MAELLLLGTGAAFTVDGSREPTMLALQGAQSTVLIDCGGNAVRQLQRMGVVLTTLERVILTHSHIDHTAGFPLLLEMLWLAGRRLPLPVHGPAEAIDVMRRVLAQWDLSRWDGLPEIQWHIVPLEQNALIVDGTEFELHAAPGDHSVPIIGIRARDKSTGQILTYGSDGAPSPSICALAQNAELLVHEATGKFPGHSTAEDAARQARDAHVKRLVLVHLAWLEKDLEAQRQAAAQIFTGSIAMGEDLTRYVW